jgi:predicted RNA-binding protein YlqC (UPF0109 family)
MQEFLVFVLRQLVDYPDEVVMTRQHVNKRTTYHVRMRPSDIGKVIGKHGQTIIAIRNLLSAAAARHGEKVQFEIVEPEREREGMNG